MAAGDKALELRRSGGELAARAGFFEQLDDLAIHRARLGVSRVLHPLEHVVRNANRQRGGLRHDFDHSAKSSKGNALHASAAIANTCIVTYNRWVLRVKCRA
jgi:hypothetical protein